MKKSDVLNSEYQTAYAGVEGVVGHIHMTKLTPADAIPDRPKPDPVLEHISEFGDFLAQLWRITPWES